MLFRIQFDDKLLADVLGDLVALRHGQERAFQFFAVPLEPRKAGTAGTYVATDVLARAGFVLESDFITGTQGVRRNVYDLAVHRYVFVSNELACRAARGSDAETVNGVIQTCFEKL